MPYKIIVRCRAGHQRLVHQGQRAWYEDIYHNVWTETVDTEEEGLDRIKNVYYPSKEIERSWLEPRYETADEELAHALKVLLITYKHLHEIYSDYLKITKEDAKESYDTMDAVIYAREALKRAKEEGIIHD